jgi:hypothetical protein
MQELDATEQDGLIISAYWPQRSTDELPIGYGGISRRFVVAESIGLALTLINRFIRLPIGAKYRAMNPWLRTSLMLCITLLMVLPRRHPKKKVGFYQLDADGTPTHYIGHFPPAPIRGHLGLSRKKFLQSLTK